MKALVWIFLINTPGNEHTSVGIPVYVFNSHSVCESVALKWNDDRAMGGKGDYVWCAPTELIK